MITTDHASAVVAALLSVAAPTLAQLPPSAATFGGQPSVAIPIRLVHGLIVIPVMINGHGPLQMILDTGAPVILVPDTALATRLGLRIVGQARVGGTGDGAMQTAPLAAGITARVGALEVTGAFGIVGVAGDVIPGVDGVIGGALFRHAVVEVDWTAGQVRFHDPAVSRATIAGDTLALRVEPSQHSYVPAIIVVGGAARRVDLHFDTGARQALTLSPSTLAAMGTKPRVEVPAIVGFGSRGAARGSYIRSDTLRLGGVALASIATAVPANETADQGRIGLPILRRFDFVIDYPGQRLVLRPRAGISEAFRFTTTGIQLAPGRDSSRRVVANVIPGSPAEAAGIAAGDSVVAVAGADIAALDLDALDRALLSPAPGTPITVTIHRRHERIERRIIPRSLLP